jgi:glycine/D-amino acid oxidase-like deaminating enzyme
MRIYHPSAFDFSHNVESWWQASAPPLGVEQPSVEGVVTVDAAVIGSGFTGLHAAYRLARTHGMSVAVVDAAEVGWGASGRNGGFCCAGSSKLSHAQMKARYGEEATCGFYRSQVASVDHVGAFLAEHGIDADRSGDGEYQLAHRPRDMDDLREEQALMSGVYGVPLELLDRDALKARGMESPAFFGGLRSPVGFGLHPLKYVRGLARVAMAAGVTVYARSPVTRWDEQGGAHVLKTPGGEVRAKRVLLATNGYTDETLPPWIGGRLLPALSRVIVTRPISDNELKAQGWVSHNMAYDTRNLVHYFRLLPGNRFLFGGRGGTDASPEGLKAVTSTLRRHFESMFPEWAHVETTHAWAGFVCLTASLVPYIGPVGDRPNGFAALAYHGNGVAMGSYAGHLVADLMAGAAGAADRIPEVMRGPLKRFPFPAFRVPYLKAAYAIYGYKDERN